MMSKCHALLKELDSMKKENCNLQEELHDSSSNLTRLENEASKYKGMLTEIRSAMEEKFGSSHDSSLNFQTDLAYNQEAVMKNEFPFTNEEAFDNSNLPLDQNSNDESNTDHNCANQSIQSSGNQTLYPPESPNVTIEQRSPNTTLPHGERLVGGGGGQKSQSNSPSGSPSKKRSCPAEREIYTSVQELDQDRTSIVREIESEEKQRKGYYEQLEVLTNKLASLPMTETYNLQADMTRRQLEYESQRIRDLMQENFGTTDQIAQRHEARLQRIRMIEAEMLRMQQRHRDQLEQENQKRDSGTCDHLETDQDGVIVLDASTNTEVTGDAFVSNPSGEGAELPQGDNGILLSGSSIETPQCLSDSMLNTDAAPAPHRLSNQNLAALYHGGWPIEKDSKGEGSLMALANQDTASVMSFNSSNTSSGSTRGVATKQQLGTKVEMVYSLLSMLGTHDKDDMSRTLLAMSSSQDSCLAMRQSGCLPLLIQLLHGSDKDSGLLGNTRGSKAARARAAAALHNIVHSHPDDKRGRREARVLRLLEQIRAHCDQLRGDNEEEEEDRDLRKGRGGADIDHHPGPAIAALMKLSFDEEHRHAICILGGLQAIAELLLMDHNVNGNTKEQYNITMRRYACMALTNLTFGDGTNKALLCSMKASTAALVSQLHSSNEDLRQVAASVLRNLSWRADLASKQTLRNVGAVGALMVAAMEVKKESTLKSILSALWNLSAHCSENKADICAIDNSLAFLVSTLTYKSPSKTLAINENGGGILRNISSHIAVREDYRQVLRSHGCLQILLKHLRSPSLTIVSNACGTLWNLSARCQEDQQALWEMGAVSMLRNLVHSKHKVISMGSSAALKNLLAAKPAVVNINEAGGFSKSNMPSLHVRKQRALEAELDQNLAETCENMESPTGSPTEQRKHDPQSGNSLLYARLHQEQENHSDHRRPLLRGNVYARSSSQGEGASPTSGNRLRSPGRPVSRTGSQDSVGSIHSDISHDRGRVHNMLVKSNKLLQERPTAGLERRRELQLQQKLNGMDIHRTTTENERGRAGVPPNSRIMQVMQEVAQHAGLEGKKGTVKESYPPFGKESHSAENTPPSMRRSHPGSMNNGSRKIPVFTQLAYPKNRGQEGVVYNPRTNNPGLNNSQNFTQDNRNAHYGNLSQRMENLHLNDDEDEQPIDYSVKYSDSPRGNNNQESQHGNFVKPTPKVGNYVAGLMYSTSGPQTQASQKMINVTAHSSKYSGKSNSLPPSSSVAATVNTSMNKSMNSSMNKSMNTSVNTTIEVSQYNGYAETDLDDMDQPTNYSIRYAEHDEGPYTNDQPINYSTRYKESEDGCTDCKETEGRRTNNILEHSLPDAYEDTVRTYCTEGTPLNFMSTATSMNDLSSKNTKQDEAATKCVKHGSDQAKGTKETASVSGKQSEIEFLSSSGSQSTERQTSSTVVPQSKNVEAANIQNNNVPVSSSSEPSSHNPSMYSYNDSSSSASPSEKPKTYCVEGTPTCNMSRQSSLSSLHSSEANDRQSNSSHTPDQNKTMVLQSIDENESLDNTVIHNADNTLKQDETPDHNTSGPAKSVTFDDNNQVQETPLMFSRCSSLGSLSSFDAHSVHSSVISEYSRRASEVVSPSDLPDSPSETMPSSPTTRKSPAKFESPDLQKLKQNNIKVPLVKKENVMKSNEQKFQPSKGANVQREQGEGESIGLNHTKVFLDSSHAFAVEGSPTGNFSSATSLSALTFDDEDDNKMRKDPELRRIPLGQENFQLDQTTGSDAADKTLTQNQESGESKIEKTLTFSENSSESDEGDEDMLAACISSAMPMYSSKKKMKKSSSDGHLKKKQVPIFMKISTPNTAFKKNKMATSGKAVPSGGNLSPKNIFPPKMSVSYHEDFYATGGESPRKYATEGTPINFSRAGSFGDLSNLSFGSEDAKQLQNKGTKSPKQDPDKSIDEKSDVSSTGEDCEDLLSEMIQAAMPKSKNLKKKLPTDIDRTAEGSDTKDRSRFQSPNFMSKDKHQAQMKTPQRPNYASDSVKTYATEGTPINFSRAASPGLSELTFDDGADGQSEGGDETQPQPQDLSVSAKKVKKEESFSTPEKSIHQETDENRYQSFHDDSIYIHGAAQCYDSPRVFGLEGTPMSYSRNDSLSSLSCEEDAEPSNEMLRKLPRGGLTPKSGMSSPRNRILSPRRPGSGVSDTTASRLRSGSGGKVQKSLQYKSDSDSPPSKYEEDHMKSFAVEGTPVCYSRNSSLSSFGSDHHEAMANHSSGSDQAHGEGGLFDESRTYQVEDTPANCLSRMSPLSTLSVESMTDEPTESEQALLDECINAAMPKSKPGKKSGKSKKSPDGQKSLPGDKKDAFLASPTAVNETSSSNSKNGQRRVMGGDSSKNAEATKNQKEASNQELILGTSSSEVMEAASKLQELCVTDNKSGLKGSDTYETNLCEAASNLPEISSRDGSVIVPNNNASSREEKRKTHSIDSLDDITKETFPDMGFALLSSGTSLSPDEEKEQVFLEGPGNSNQNNSALMSDVLNDDALIEEAQKILMEVQFGYGDEEEQKEKDQPPKPVPQENQADSTIDSSFEQENSSFDNISPEEELELLEQNANIVLNELSNMQVSSSTVESANFVENETMSLVSMENSNDGNLSDCNSEDTDTISKSSHATSEQASEASTTLSCASSSQIPGIKRPRIIKPPSGPTINKPKAEADKDAPKAIRGKRKGLFGTRDIKSITGTKSPTAVVKPKASPSQRTPKAGLSPLKSSLQTKGKSTTTPGRGVSPKSPAQTQVKATVSKLTPKQSPRELTKASPKDLTKASPKDLTKASPKDLTKASPKDLTKASPKDLTKASPKDLTKASPKVTKPKSNIAKPTTATKQIPVKSSPSRVPTPNSKKNTQIPQEKKEQTEDVSKKSEEVERPKPPIKQGTFTMDSPTQNAPEISPTTSLAEPNKRCSTASFANSNRNSNSSGELKYSKEEPENKSPKPESPVAAGVKLREKRTSSGTPPRRESPPTPLNRTFDDDSFANSSFESTDSSPSGSSSSPGSSKIGLAKGANASRMSKTGGLTRNNATSNLVKTGSSNSLKGTNRNGIPNSESQTSLKKNVGSSRSTTPTRSSIPNGRKSSSGSVNSTTSTGSSVTGTKKASVGKRQAVSKIASLWRKDSKDEEKNIEEKDRTPGTTPTKTEKKSPPKPPPRVSSVPKSKQNGSVSPKAETSSSNANKTTTAKEEAKTSAKSQAKVSKKLFGVKKNTIVKKEETKESKAKEEKIKKSGTFDKLEAEVMDESTAQETELSIPDENNGGKNNTWRRTYTIQKEEEHEPEEKPVETKVETKKSSFWRRNPPSKNSKKEETKAAKKEETKASKKEDKKNSKKEETKATKKDEKKVSKKETKQPKAEASKNASPSPVKKDIKVVDAVDKDDDTTEKDESLIWIKVDGAFGSPKMSTKNGMKSDQLSPQKKDIQSEAVKPIQNGTPPQQQSLPPVKSPPLSPKSKTPPQFKNQIQVTAQIHSTSATTTVMVDGSTKLTPTGPNAAIVAPFNYTPNASAQKSSANKSEPEEKTQEPVKPMTKTEMLMERRRRSYMTSVKMDDGNDDKKSTGGKSGSCLVTTV